MYQFLAVFALAVSCVTSFPVLFLTYEDGDGSKSTPRLLDCVSPIPFLDDAQHGISYRCRPSAKTPESLGLKSDELPILEILEEPSNDISAIEIDEDIIIPKAEFVPAHALFQSSEVVVKTEESDTDDKDKYEVPEGRTRNSKKKNQGGCKDNEVFVAELDICMPYESPSVEHSVAPVNADKPTVSVISPHHTITNVGYAPLKCPEGEIHSPSIGICVPIDNCWPHPDCSHITNKDKPKNKKKNNSRATVHGEDDD